MPNEPRNKTGRSLRQQLSAAAKLTAEEQAQRQSKKRDKAAGKSSHAKPKTSKRRASKEQTEEAKKKGREAGADKAALVNSVLEFLGGISFPVKVLGSILIVLVLSMAILYPAGCAYYQAFRQDQRDQAELAAISQRNEVLESENKALETPEGIETQARKEYGWVKKGEKATVVTNADESAEGDLLSQVKSDEIEAPHTWYYDILDFVFRSDVK